MDEIYLDNAATTKVDTQIAAVALDIMTLEYGNPSSLHKKGISAGLRLEEAREKVASALGATKEEIVFTSGGTEANNLAVFGAVNALVRSGKTIVSTAWEHSSVLQPARELEKQGYILKIAYPDQNGEMEVQSIAGLVDEDTVLVSCMLVNSEVGAIADIAKISQLVRRKNKKTMLHCDAVQGFGKIPLSIKKLDVDLLSVSGHKIHAPKGVGALYIKKNTRILPRMFGGGQERALRPGTQALPLIAAFGEAAFRSADQFAENYAHVRALHDYFVKKAAIFPGLCMNSPAEASPYICNVSLPGRRSEILLHYLAAKGIYVSSGSACSGGKSSHVLAAMGLARERADSALRVSFCRHNTTDEIDAFFRALEQGMKEILA